MKYLLALSLLLVINAPVNTHAATAYRQYKSRTCAYSIKYPASWRVTSSAAKHADVFKDGHRPVVSATVGCLPTGGALTIPKIIGIYRRGLQQTGFTVGATHLAGGVANFTAVKNTLKLQGHTYAAKVDVTLVLNGGYLFVLTFTDDQVNWTRDNSTYRYMKSTWSVLKGK